MKEDSLYCWYLGDPEQSVLVGEVQLDVRARSCILMIDPSWSKSGFDLVPYMPKEQRLHAPMGDLRAPGAIDDAMPDRWGERMIRVIFRPSRMSPLEMLWYAGDRRFGALGFSSSPDAYIPCEEPPLLCASSIAEAEAIIHRVLERDPLSERERQLIASAGSLGGAHPKMLVEHEGLEWTAKFPRGSNVDQLLIEHASMKLARCAGMSVAESIVLPGGIDHILLVQRFDRSDAGRKHAVSARTMLARETDDSYAAISALIRKYGLTDRIKFQQLELFRRMAFNIMIDNTDDHTKNHAFLRNEDGAWYLSPAYDVPTQMNGLGQQAIQISADPFLVNRFDRDHAVSAAANFGMDKAQALEEWNRVAGHISLWRESFAQCGVLDQDLQYLGDFLDKDELKAHRIDAIKPSDTGCDGGPK